MRKKHRIFNMTKSELNRGIFTLGLSVVIGFFVVIYLFSLIAIFVFTIIAIVLLIIFVIKYSTHKKISPIIDKLDECDTSEFIDLASDIYNTAFNNGYILHSDFMFGIKVISYEFLQTEEIITYNQVLVASSDNINKHKGIITNSYLNKEALSYCKRNAVIVVDRDTLIDMMIFNLKHK